MHKVAYLCCILDKPEQVERLIKSARQFKHSTIIFGVSQEHLELYPSLENFYTVSHETNTVDRYNQLYKKAREDGGFTHYGFIGHDCEFSTDFEDHFNMALREMDNFAPDKKYMLYPNDGIHGQKLATHPVFSKEWLDALGYFFPKGYMRHCFVDNYMMRLGAETRRLGYTEAELIHHHPIKNGDNLDIWQQRVYENGFYEHDKEAFNRCIKDCLDKDKEKLSVNRKT